MRKPDGMEQEIISLLQEDGRMPYVKIAQILGVTEGTIRRKVQALMDEGIINIAAICNPFMIGFDAPAFIGMDVERSRIKEVTAELVKMPEVQFLAVTTGPYDIITQVVLRSNSELYDFILNKLAALDGIKDTHTFLIMNICKQTWNLKYPGERGDSSKE